MRRTLLLAGLLCLSLVAADARACETYPTWSNNFTTEFRNGDLNSTLGDYGLIFEDAKSRDCSGGAWSPKQGAYRALLDKINKTFEFNNPFNDPLGGTHTDGQGRTGVRPFQGWLEGGSVTLIFASALQIGGYGDLDSTLDAALMRVRDSYKYERDPNSTCGFFRQSGWLNGGDTCMEEHAVAASAYAWIAAYEYKRGRSATTYVNAARQQIIDSFSTYDSICISNYNVSPTTWDWQNRGPCDIDLNPTDPASFTTAEYWLKPQADGKTRADILALNRNENIVYGAGLLTLINGALVGLAEAGATTSLSPYQKVIAGALIEEAQRKTEPGGMYFKGGLHSPTAGTCARFEFNDFGIITRVDNRGCADGNAVPKIYNLNSKQYVHGISGFHEKYVGSTYPVRTQVYDHVNGGFYLQSAYQFDQFDVGAFTKNAADPTQNWGRRVTYGYLGWGWNTVDSNRDVDNTYYGGGDKRPRLWGYLDNYNPKGYLDSIDANGVARGWTCDQDLPNKSNSVDFYVNGLGGTFAVRGLANQAHESGVTAECGGGSYHRFVVQLPSWTKGQWIYAYGLDATWRGFTQLNGVHYW